MSGGAGVRVGLGVIGLGTVAQAVHLPLLSRHRDRLQVTALCDLSAELMAVVAERFGLGAARCPSAGELLGSGRVDEGTDRLGAVALGPAPAELGRLYTEVVLGSVVHDLAVVRMLAGEPERVVHVDAWPEEGWASVAVEAVGPGVSGSGCGGITWRTIPSAARRSGCTTSGGRWRWSSPRPTCSTPRPS
jgi:hypothetical protein